MNQMYIVSFNSTHHAIRSEKLFGEKGLKVMALPTPREITASCGISIKFSFEDIEKIKTILIENNVDIKGIYCISKLEDGSKEAKKLD